MNYNDIDEQEIIALLGENDEQIRNIIYDKYSFLVDVILNKYQNAIKYSKINIQDIRCEALYGFSDGINSFSNEKDTSLKTFLYLCIERRVLNCIRNNMSNKIKILKDSLSLEYSSDNDKLSLSELIGDDNKFNPLNNIVDKETYKEIYLIAKNNLSNFEFTVFNYMINNFSYIEIASLLNKSPKQIDNAMQRIKSKMKTLIEKEEII
ncbi:MAG: hypothetical protein PUD07_02490 [bacterium]|nr:hypothetical protein [bacterium]